MSKTVLVVDDEPIVVEISKRKLEENGFEVMTASDGVMALKQLASKIPHLILLDIDMPGMNGYTFLLEKNKVEAYANIPVLVVTAHGETEPLFKRHGIHAFVLKPLKLPDLLAKIFEIIGPVK